jgi:hypothetical protein
MRVLPGRLALYRPVGRQPSHNPVMEECAVQGPERTMQAWLNMNIKVAERNLFTRISLWMAFDI